MGHDQRVIVHVDDARLRRDPLSDLVSVVRRRQAGADVQELANARLASQVADRADQEATVGASALADLGHEDQRPLGELAVDLEVVLATQ